MIIDYIYTFVYTHIHIWTCNNMFCLYICAHTQTQTWRYDNRLCLYICAHTQRHISINTWIYITIIKKIRQ